MELLQIFRIESSLGKGFYSCDSYDVLGGECDSERHPMPSDDSKWSYEFSRYSSRFPAWELSERHIFGFKSIEQLRHWFYNDVWLQRMSECNMQICVYEVEAEHTLIGRTQLTFPKESRCILRFDPKWLLAL